MPRQSSDHDRSFALRFVHDSTIFQSHLGRNLVVGPARLGSVAARSLVMFNASNMRFLIISGRIKVLRDRTSSRACSQHQLSMIKDTSVVRLVVQLVVPPDD